MQSSKKTMLFSDNKQLPFDELFDLDELQKIQDLFSNLTGIASIITLPDGTPITKPSNFCCLCELIRETDKGLRNCMKSDSHLSIMSLNSTSGHAQPCLSAGLWDGAVNIVVDGVHIGNWLVGQVINDEIDINNIVNYAETIGANKNDIIDAYSKVTVLSSEKLKTVTLFLHSFVKELSQKASYKYKLKQEAIKCEQFKAEVTQSVATYKKTINSINQAVVVCTPDSKITFHNLAVKSIFNIPESQIKGINLENFKFELFNKNCEKLAESEFPVNVIANSKHAIEGELYGVSINELEIVWIKLNGNPVFSPENELVEIIFSFEDVTTEKVNNDSFISKIHFLEKIQRSALIGTYTASINEDKWYGSKLLFEILGLDSQKIKTHNDWIDLIHPEFKAGFLATINESIDTNKATYSNTYKIIKKNSNEERWVRDHATIIKNQKGEPDIIVGTLQDVTDIKNAEEAALLSEKKYKTVLENVMDVYYKMDINGTICEISPSIKHYTTLKHEDLIGQKYTKFFVNSQSEKEFKERIYNDKKIQDYCTEICLNGTKTIPVSISATLTCDAADNPEYIEGFVRDISNRKYMQDMLKSSESKFRSYIEFSPHAVVVSDISGKFIEVNTAATRLTGNTVEELLSMDKYSLFTESSQEKFTHHNQKTRNYGLASDELELKTKWGEIKHVLVDSVKMPDQKHIGFVSDVSYHKKIENKLRQEHEYLEEVQRIARIGNATIDFAKGTWESSKTLDDIIGIDKDYEKKIENWIKIIHPDTLPELDYYFRINVIEQRTNIETEFKIIRHNDQQIRWLYVIGQPEFDNFGKIKKLLFTLQDITERKEWTNKLYQNEALYRTTLNASPDVIVVVDLDGKVKMLSPVAKQMYGSDNLDLIIGHSITDFIADEDIPKLQKNFILMFNGYLGTIEYKMKRANGEIFPTEVNGDVIRDSNGLPSSLVFIIRDITQRKLAEEALAHSKSQLKEFAGHLQSIREEEKIALAREIHDDLGQILVAMKIDMGMFKRKLINPKDQLSITFIDQEMTRMLELTNKTIATARRIMTDLRSDTVNNLGFIEAAKMYIENFNERYEIECMFENDVSEIKFSQKQTVALYRILQESLNNIIKHANASHVKVKLSKTADIMSLHIVDNGCGFEINGAKRVDSYGLTGMKERVALLEGKIKIDSKIGKGTSICIEIPDIRDCDIEKQLSFAP